MRAATGASDPASSRSRGAIGTREVVMNAKARIATTALLGLTTLALASSAVAAGPQGSYRDANERAAAARPASASAYSDANSRSQPVHATSPAGAAAALDVVERIAAAAGVPHDQI